MDTRQAEPSSVGEILCEEFLRPMGMSEKAAAEALGISEAALLQIADGSRRISCDEAASLGRLFGMESSFWLNLQAAHDRWEARMKAAAEAGSSVSA